MSKRAILFDADGVIISSEMFSIPYQREFGVLPDAMLPFFHGIFKKCLIGKADLKVAVQPYLAQWKWNGSVEDFLVYWFKSEHAIDQKLVEVINKLRKGGALCFLATNQEKYRTEYIRTIMGFKNIVDGIFSSAEIGFCKPDVQFFKSILSTLHEKYNISGEESLFIDDDILNVEAANGVGINSYLYSDFENFLNFIKKYPFSNSSESYTTCEAGRTGRHLTRLPHG